MEYKLFLVFDNNDIDKMIDVLKWAKGGCKGDILDGNSKRLYG